MKKSILIAITFLAAAACVKEQPRTGQSLTIRAGFEQPEVKTYLKNDESGAIMWSGTAANDKVVYAFTSTGEKFPFTSTSETSEPTRSFTCANWPGGKWTYAIWTGVTADRDSCELCNGIFTGNTLQLSDSQTMHNSASFNHSGNISVMKPTDAAFRNVFGYLRFTLPTYPNLQSCSAIKSVQFTADENVAGDVHIDYSGADPVATIIDNANASKSITLNARLKGSDGYEAGIVYMILPPGTYHNARLTLTPFTSEPLTANATTGEPYTLDFDGDVVVYRGQYTEVGLLPAELCFDYRLSAGQTHVASLSSTAFAGYGITSSNRVIPSSSITVDGMSYCGPGVSWYGNRIAANKEGVVTSSGPIIPTSNYFSFKINKPGTLRFYQAPASGIERIPTYYLTVVSDTIVTKHFKPTTIADGSDEHYRDPQYIYSGAFSDYWVSMKIETKDLKGNDKPATVYLFHRSPENVNTLMVYYWPLEWTATE